MVIPEWAIGGAVIVFAVALAQIVVVKLRASVRTLPASDHQIGELRQALDAVQSRLGEVEERLDFTERLLAQHREPDRLEPPPADSRG
jgi:hypothetical protein